MTLYGLENISAHNGWAISFVGITIVFTGLTLLSLSIAQLHKILNLWENKDKYINNRNHKTSTSTPAQTAPKPRIPSEDLETIRQYKMIVDRLEQPFSLPKLLDTAMKIGLDRPHSTINKLLEKKIIISDGTGYFIWTL
jgi:hypothetical protein